MPAPLQEMVRALDEGIAVLRARGGGASLALQGGERLEAVDGVGPGGHVLYRFPLPQASALRDDTPVRVQVAHREKVAFVDRAVTWQGSLNILSCGASTEVMFRLVHPEFHRRLTALLLPPPRSTSPERRASAMPTPGARATQTTPAGVCPRRSGRLLTRQGPSSTFLGCSRYPACTFTQAMPREG